MTTRNLAASGLLLALVLLAGCGTGCGLSGTVTFEGEPVKEGWIHITPADGIGQPASAPVKNGRYAIRELQPGPKIVLIEAVPEIPHAKTTAEMEERARKGLPPADVAVLIPPDAEGNNVTIELAAGQHVRDFALSRKK